MILSLGIVARKGKEDLFIELWHGKVYDYNFAKYGDECIASGSFFCNILETYRVYVDIADIADVNLKEECDNSKIVINRRVSIDDINAVEIAFEEDVEESENVKDDEDDELERDNKLERKLEIKIFERDWGVKFWSLLKRLKVERDMEIVFKNVRIKIEKINQEV
ncbi:MAG: hypothetical protein JHC31_05060 [Sulfurihydrogenibium sp.]|jgi:hypothetical protein|nr:hypothetical protein [Sulfurihydrogenibium sp.]